MEKDIKDLIIISRKYGSNPDYVIAGGGNTSYKNNDKIWVKASGSSLAEIDESGFVCLDRELMKLIAVKQYSHASARREEEVKNDLNKAILYPIEKRPSVEVSMHEAIQYPFVVHTHPTLVNGMLCANESRHAVLELFGEEVLYIEYTDPGYVLYMAVNTALNRFRLEKGCEPKIIFLENHGVFVAAETCEEIDSIYSDIIAKLNGKMSLNYGNENPSQFVVDESVAEFFALNSLGSFYTLSDASELSLRFVKDQTGFGQVSIPFTPDNIVYCKSIYLFVDDEKDIPRYFITFDKKHGYYPKVIAVKGKGLITVEENPKSAQIVLDVFKDMMKVSYLTQYFGGSRPMNQRQIDFIDNWEVENYRRKVSKDS